jgi:hypothetical protein
MTIEQRDTVKEVIPFFISGAAALAMGAVIVASLFIGPGPRVGERAPSNAMSHAQHHISIR